jgi:hypothetical protein
MFVNRQLNLHRDRQQVIDMIASCTRKQTFNRSKLDYETFSIPLHTMLVEALLTSLPASSKHRIFNEKICRARKVMVYGVFIASFGQRLLLSAIYRPPVFFNAEATLESVKENQALLEKLKSYIRTKYSVDHGDMAKDFEFHGFKTASGPNTNEAYEPFNKKVVLTGSVFYCDDITELDEIGIMEIKEADYA